MSNKIEDILRKSKAIMKKSDEEYGSPVSKVSKESKMGSPVVYEEKEIPNLTEQFIQKYGANTNQKSVAPKNGEYRNIEKSKLPKAILEAMINNPIEIPESPFPTFGLDDVADLVQESTQRPIIASVNESVNVNRDSIKQIVKEEFEDMVRSIIEEYMDKSLIKEDIQIKIGSTIFSGSLKPLPKKK
jgi:phenylalanyl-tRNA synthetase alpha subunit